jgi:ABC-2 type transport system permease protein
MSLRRTLRQTMTVARRDFVATVFTPIFLLFLFAPVIMGAFGAVGGMGAASVAGDSAGKARMVAIVPPDQARIMAEADRRLRTAFRRDEAPPRLLTIAPSADPAAQARTAFESQDYDAAGVLYGALDKPTVLFGPLDRRTARYLGILSRETLADQRLGAEAPTVTVREVRSTRQGASRGGQNQSAFLAVFGVFFLTLFLAGQVVGTMAEERNNKVIEVLAAAVPLESVFLGKLLGMFGVAVLFVVFWGTILGQVGSFLPPAVGAAMGELTPAVGGPAFALLFFAYFTMAYLLLGSVFLGVGAQASTMREIQMLSLPITIVQVGMFALSSAAASRPDSWLATGAELFPLSSPFAMAAHAANSPALWPHVAALAWQALWVAIFITVGARLFRRGVLQSGSGPGWLSRMRGRPA